MLVLLLAISIEILLLLLIVSEYRLKQAKKERDELLKENIELIKKIKQ